eukprot:COSAG01_NODE_11122_length_2002_cov_1.596952_2_plen_376_part_00
MGTYSGLARNITLMAQNARRFLCDFEPATRFFLYVGFGDQHRAGPGIFAERFGIDPTTNRSMIPGWDPRWFSPDGPEVSVPPWLPDHPMIRRDLAAAYTSLNRLDQGVGLILGELQAHGSLDNTLVIYFADNGVPFPRGKTNLFETGQGEPLIVVNPKASNHHGDESAAIVSSLDLAPTMLEAAGLDWRACTSVTKLGATAVTHRLQGQSLLPLTTGTAAALGGRGTAFGSHTYHTAEAFYPMRSVVTRVAGQRFRLIHNLQPRIRHPELWDYLHTDWWPLLANGSIPYPQFSPKVGEPLAVAGWFDRPEWQLFNVDHDPLEQHNLLSGGSGGSTTVLATLRRELTGWLNATGDPWFKMCTSAAASVGPIGCGTW